MATVHNPIHAAEAEFLSSVFPQVVKGGASVPVLGLAFDAAADEAAFFRVDVSKYASGNPSLDVDWYADTASTGDVVWEVALAAVTPNTDTQDVEAKALAAAQTVTDSHLGTTGQRLHRASVTVTNLDSVAAGDEVWLRVRRLGSSGSDTMAGDAVLVGADFQYSDT